MTPGLVDLILILVLILYAIGGYRRGLLVTVVGMVGLLAGVALCLWLLPEYLDALVPDRFRVLRAGLLVAAVFLAGGLGQMAALRLVRTAHVSLHRSRARPLDSLLGAVLTTAVAAGLIWFAAGVLRSTSSTSLGAALGRSQVLTTIDSFAPSSSDAVLRRALVALDDYGFPRVFDQLSAEPIHPVEPADPNVVKTAGIRRAAESVVRIDALAVSCGQSQEGTGFVARPSLVVTNAHVVAGSERVSVRADGRKLSAVVVAFDPARDLAVLSVPDLAAPALPTGPELEEGDQAVVAGYPLAGPYHLDAARVRGVIDATGDDIYGRGKVEREVYSLRVSIEPGNSGGPLLTPDGQVSGVIFARSLDDAGTAYALTLGELNPVLSGVSSSRQAVGTGSCAR